MNMKRPLNISVVSSFIDRFNTTKLEYITCSANLYANERAKLLKQILERKKVIETDKNIWFFSSTGIRKNERKSIPHNQKINSHYRDEVIRYIASEEKYILRVVD